MSIHIVEIFYKNNEYGNKRDKLKSYSLAIWMFSKRVCHPFEMPEDISVTKIDETSTKEYLPVSLFNIYHTVNTI